MSDQQDFAAIIERDRGAIHGDDDTPEHMQATTDRGVLLVLLKQALDGYFRYMPPTRDGHSDDDGIRAAWRAFRAVDEVLR